MSLLSTDPLFDGEATRALVHAVHGGADFGECLTTMQRVPPGDTAAWAREWTATADRVAAIGDACAAAGHVVSARDAWLRAANYCRASYTFLYGNPVTPALVAAFDRESATFAKAAAACEPALRPVEIPYENTTLPGYFCPGGPGVRPLLVCTNGYDSTVHEMYFAFATAARARGYHCLLFDGPGQGRALFRQRLVMRHDWEHVVRPVIDFAQTLPGVDARRIALSGWSFGGYLALRAAAFEPRLAACVLDPGLMGLAGPMAKLLAALPPAALADPLAADPALFAPFMAGIEASAVSRWKVVQRAFMVHGITSLPAYVAASRDYDASGVVGQVRCPTFVALEESDALAQSAPDVYAALTCPKTLQRFTVGEGAGDHCAMMARTLFLQRMFDWLDGVVARR